MVNFRPEHCPYCGTALTATTTAEEVAGHCPDCDRPVFHNPVATASVAVVDGGELLLVQRAGGSGAGEWLVPGGHLAVGERPVDGAVRELREETGLVADPAALELLYADAIEPTPGKHNVMLRYAVGAGTTTGSPTAGSDAAAARFFTPGEFATSDEVFHDVPGLRYGGEDLDELVALAHRALTASE